MDDEGLTTGPDSAAGRGSEVLGPMHPRPSGKHVRLRQRAWRDPYDGEPPGWSVRRGSSCDDGNRGCGNDDGCWAGKCASRGCSPLCLGDHPGGRGVLFLRPGRPAGRRKGRHRHQTVTAELYPSDPMKGKPAEQWVLPLSTVCKSHWCSDPPGEPSILVTPENFLHHGTEMASVNVPHGVHNPA